MGKIEGGKREHFEVEIEVEITPNSYFLYILSKLQVHNILMLCWYDFPLRICLHFKSLNHTKRFICLELKPPHYSSRL